jgi:hypothetical protein
MTSNSSGPPAVKPDTPPEQKTKKLDLSLSQTLGGALAAMTAAALGSRLGVGGTIVGAALASIIAGVGGTLYTASLRTTRQKVQTVWSGRVAGTDTKTAVDVVPSAPETETSAGGFHWDAPPTTAPVARVNRRALPWKPMLVGVVAIFAIAAVALTGFEMLAGASLSGGKGTTIEQVAKERKPATKKTTKATPTESASSSASASESASENPSEAATETPSEAPSEAPSANEQPSDAPAASDEPTTEEPSASATQEPSEDPAGGAPQGENPSEAPTTSSDETPNS